MGYSLKQTLLSPSPNNDNDDFGLSVSLYGNYLVVGDYDAEPDPSFDGRVYFYRMNVASGQFDLIQTITSPSPRTGGVTGDAFGGSVSLYGNYLVVGDYNAEPDPSFDGRVYFYRMDR